MPEFCGPYVYATLHEFKNNISQWTRMLEVGAYDGIFITRHGIVVAAYMTAGVRSAEEKIRAKHGPRVENALETKR